MSRGAAPFLGLLLLGACDAAGSSGDELEARARATLTRQQMSAVELTRVDERTFDFTAQKDGASCAGTVIVNSPTTAAMSFECE